MLAAAPGLGELNRIVARCLEKSPDARYRSTHDLVAELEQIDSVRASSANQPASRTPQAGQIPTRRALVWWQFHQAMASLGYVAMLVPLWLARGWTSSGAATVLFFIALAAVLVATTLRLHVWFAVRELPRESGAQRARAAAWIRLADIVFVLVLFASSALAFGEHTEVAVLFVTAAIGALVAFAVIEPATTRAAFAAPAEPTE